MTSLHITNGDASVSLFKAANVKGDFLPWRDVLHLGPVVETDSIKQLSTLRAQFLSYLGWGQFQKLLSDFEARDAKLDLAFEYDHIYLWFEHDLYDQLQLIQILEWLYGQDALIQKTKLIQADHYIGYHRPSQVPELFNLAKPITNEQVSIAVKVFTMFKRGEASKIMQLKESDLKLLPYLSSAIIRLLDELPNDNTGCTQTEYSILELIGDGFQTKQTLFKAYCKKEPVLFHGDMGFFHILEQMRLDSPNLVEKNELGYMLSEVGHQVLNESKKWERQYTMLTWLGGLNISGHEIELLAQV